VEAWRPGIKKIIARDLEEGLREMYRNIAPTSRLYNDATALMARHEEVKKNFNRQIIDYEEYSRLINHIRHASLDLVDSLQSDDWQAPLLSSSVPLATSGPKKTLAALPSSIARSFGPVARPEKQAVLNLPQKYQAHAITAAILAVLAGILWLSDVNSEKQVAISLISAYYKSIETNDLSALQGIIHNPMDRYFNTQDIPLTEIIKDAQRYNSHYPYRVHKPDWESLKIKNIQDGAHEAQLSLTYQVRRGTDKPWLTYHLIHTFTFSDQNKLTGISEIQLSRPD
jgi:hypothetical protein